MGTLEAKLKRYALYLLDRRDYSSQEMKRKLAYKIADWEKRNILSAQDDDTYTQSIERVLAYLLEQGLIDDTKFAYAYVRNLEERGRSVRDMRARLTKKGISSEVIDTVLLQKQDSETDKIEKIIAHAQMYKPHLLDSQTDKVKLMQKLARRGYMYSDIKKALEKAHK